VARRRGELNSGATGRSGSPWWLLYGGGRSAGGDRRGGGGQAAGCWGGKASGVRAVLAVVQTWPEEDRGGARGGADIAEALGGSGAAPVALFGVSAR
jgi:hypothetical protein